DLFKGRWGGLALFGQLDDVPAELGLNGSRNIASFRELKGGCLKGRNHHALAKVAEVAAIGCARIDGVFARQGGEISAAINLGLERIGLFLGLDEDVAGAD